MPELEWKGTYLYHRKLYVGRVLYTLVGDHSPPEAVEKPWRAVIQTSPTGAVVDRYSTENAAKVGLEAAVRAALSDEAA